MKNILVTGAFGLVGSDLVLALQKKYGKQKVICLGHHNIRKEFDGTLVTGDVTDKKTIKNIIDKYDIATVYHLAGILSAGSEKNPQLAWKVNYVALKNILDLAITRKFKIFWPNRVKIREQFGLIGHQKPFNSLCLP